MRKLFKLTFFVAIVLSLGMIAQSCKSTKSSASNTTSSNISGIWVLKTFNGQNSTDIFTRKTPTITIDQTNGEITGNGGCNGISGMFTYKKGVFSAPNMVSTMMYCEDAKQEPQLVQMLGKENKVEVVNDILTFRQKGKVVAEFVKGIDSRILSGLWTLDTLEGESATILFQNDKTPTIEFNTIDNKLGGMAGCNRYNASYTIEGSTITVGPIMTTRMACENMAGENRFIQAIENVSTMNVTANAVTFSKGGKITLKFIKK